MADWVIQDRRDQARRANRPPLSDAEVEMLRFLDSTIEPLSSRQVAEKLYGRCTSWERAERTCGYLENRRLALGRWNGSMHVWALTASGRIAARTLTG